jgi:hypothetical protein
MIDRRIAAQTDGAGATLQQFTVTEDAKVGAEITVRGKLCAQLRPYARRLAGGDGDARSISS